MNLLENVFMAWEAIKANKLRSSLTLISISIGVFAIIGAATIVSSLNNSVSGQLASLGQNTFTIDRLPHMGVSQEEWQRIRKRKPIVYRQAREFKESIGEYAVGVSITNATGGEIIKAGHLSTNPDVLIMGGDYPYFELNTRDIEDGRPLSDEDVMLSRKVAVLGKDVAVRLFPNENPLGNTVLIGADKFTVIGVMTPKGSSFGGSLDNLVVIPISFYMRAFADEDGRSVTLDVKAPNQAELTNTLDHSIGLMRILRNVQPGEDNDFEVITNESLTDQFEGFTQYISYFGAGAGMVALIAAGIGIINMMLVSVRERTREIGVRKALGARRNTILVQFLVEAVTVCLFGCFIGIILGLLGGLAMSLLMGTMFTVPFGDMVYSVLACTLIGVIFGTYPAWRASRLDPIETLRYE